MASTGRLRRLPYAAVVIRSTPWSNVNGDGNSQPQYIAYYVNNGTLFTASSTDGVNFSNDTPVNAPAGYSILATAVTTINGQGALVAAFEDSSGHDFYGITTDGTNFTIEGSVTLPAGMTVNSLIIEDGLIKFYGGISENGGANTGIELATAPVPDVEGLTLSGATISGSADQRRRHRCHRFEHDRRQCQYYRRPGHG